MVVAVFLVLHALEECRLKQRELFVRKTAFSPSHAHVTVTVTVTAAGAEWDARAGTRQAPRSTCCMAEAHGQLGAGDTVGNTAGNTVGNTAGNTIGNMAGN